MPQGVGRRGPAMGVVGTQELDGVLRLQSGQGDVCPAHTALLGEVAGVAVQTPETPPSRRRPGLTRRDRHVAEATAGNVQGNRMPPHRLAPMEADGESMLPGAGRIPTSTYHMGQMAHPERGSPLRSTPTGMETARQSAPAETYGEHRAFHERLRVAVDAGPRPLACGRICVGCRKKTGKTTAHSTKLREAHHTRGGGQRVG